MVKQICKRCDYEWDYNGKSDWYTSCPRCKTNVRIIKEIKNNTHESGESRQIPSNTQLKGQNNTGEKE